MPSVYHKMEISQMERGQGEKRERMSEFFLRNGKKHLYIFRFG